MEREDIKRIYLSKKDSPTFVVEFNQKLAQRIKTLARTNSVDYLRLLQELKHIAETSKEREYKTNQYLELVYQYCDRVVEGEHRKMHLNTQTLELVKVS